MSGGKPKEEKKKYVIPKKSKKKLAEEKAEKETVTGKVATKLELDVWFNHIRDKHWGVNGYCACMECGAAIPVNYSRHATAHLLAKKIFKSVSTHEINYMILGAGCGCHYKTDRVDQIVTLKVWPEIARRIKILMPLLPMDELRHISNQLLIALDNTP